jgi:hypothetical protein
VAPSEIYVTNARNPLGAAYGVQADVVGLGNTSKVGVLARYRDSSNHYRLYISGATPTLTLEKKVASVVTSLGTFALTGLGQSHTLKIVVTNSGVKGYQNGTLRITSADVSLTFQATEKTGMYSLANAIADHCTWDNFKSTYLQNVGTPPTPPPGGGGGGGDPGGGSGCCTGTMYYETRSGDQLVVDIWQKWVLGEWTTYDDLKTFNFETQQWDFMKPNDFWAQGVPSTFVSSFEDGDALETSAKHRVFTALNTLNDCVGVNSSFEGMLVQLSDNNKCSLLGVEEVRKHNVVYYLEMPTLNYVAKGKMGAVGKLCHNLKPL